jgi:uncharacterized protein (DUF1778 family)
MASDAARLPRVRWGWRRIPENTAHRDAADLFLELQRESGQTCHEGSGHARRLNLRTSAQQEELMRRAAQERGESLTDFIVRSACAEAERTVADQRHFSLDGEQWRAFVAASDCPVRARPRLRRLFSEISVVEQQQS